MALIKAQICDNMIIRLSHLRLGNIRFMALVTTAYYSALRSLRSLVTFMYIRWASVLFVNNARNILIEYTRDKLTLNVQTKIGIRS